MAAKNYIPYYGPLQTGFVYYTRNGTTWDKNKIRRRLTIGTRIDGNTMKHSESPEEFKDYQQAMASMRKSGLLHIKEE